jgi:sugar/nucleoside kinase (ribokinase family)
MDLQSGNQTRRARRTLDLLPLVDVVLPNLDQAVGLTGCTEPEDAAAALLAAGAGAVVITMGAEGSLYVTTAGSVHTPALRCDVRDTTGCGDAFTAGFVVATLRGHAPRAALSRATAAATLVATGLGSDAGLVDWDHLEAFLASAEPLVG